MVENHNQGIKALYRNRSEMIEDKKKKGDVKYNWWSKGKGSKPYTSILFVPPTPHGVLAKEMRKREQSLNQNNNMHIKIVEKGGIKFKNFVVKADPFPKSKCEYKCPFCQPQPQLKVQENSIDLCTTPNVGYRIKCDTCKATYEGETARLAKTRIREHLDDLLKQKSGSPLIKHINNHYPLEGGQTQFSVEVTGRFSSALSRQSDEAVRIRNSAKASTNFMNSKHEFNAAPIRRLAVLRTHAGT